MHKYWSKWHWRHDFTQLAAPAFPRGRKEYSVNADAVYRRSMRMPLDWTDEYIGVVTYGRELSKAEMKEYHLESYSLKKRFRYEVDEMQKKCQRCGNTFTVSKGNYMYCDDCRRLNIPPAPPEKEELTDNRVGQTRADISKMETVDMVNHPPHYKLSNGMESIDVIRAVLTPEEYRGWCKGNALKYQFRAGKKDPAKESEDYRKAEFYLKELSRAKVRRREILDPCCGSRMWHFDKECPEVLYMDNRRLFEELSDGRTLSVKPDELGDFTNMKYDDNTFSLIVFDPPHLLRAGENSWLRKKYGVLSDDWKADIKQGLSECWRVLKNNGTLIFKWNEEQVSFSDVKPLLPSMPIVGQRRGKTIFLVLFKSEV